MIKGKYVFYYIYFIFLNDYKSNSKYANIYTFVRWNSSTTVEFQYQPFIPVLLLILVFEI